MPNSSPFQLILTGARRLNQRIISFCCHDKIKLLYKLNLTEWCEYKMLKTTLVAHSPEMKSHDGHNNGHLIYVVCYFVKEWYSALGTKIVHVYLLLF
jgi:hypothetical protein